MKISFRVDSGSNPFYFATVIEYENGDGDLSAVELKQDTSEQWLPMQQSWGAVWRLNSDSSLVAPFSIKLTTSQFGKTIVAEKVIPNGWVPGQMYQSFVNF